MPTRICFVRHGETDWNAEKRIQGHIDVPLNETGRAQAMATAFGVAHHSFAALYASDLGRAWQTAQAAAERLGLDVRPAPGLRERNYGIFQGLTAEEGAQLHPSAHARYAARDTGYDFETGESLHSFADRVVAGVEWLVRHHAGQTILAVSHGGVLDIIYRKATGRTLEAPRDFKIPNCALNWFVIDAHGWHLQSWADRHHLERVLEQVVE
ncbi:MAG: histidine phosphatase family protein [Gammaproteobacteria bacterium]|nr:histidine phosphatase family protein [Gammaproteobacteria bacterium]MBU1645876.1 histidine phosphatase family protein [Gammaproteobacteria bacterium]MBU1971938.1 histidine phosphatase family protein [Gammaproteobacteria bacterium]